MSNVIVSFTRTPIGSFLGSLSSLSSDSKRTPWIGLGTYRFVVGRPECRNGVVQYSRRLAGGSVWESLCLKALHWFASRRSHPCMVVEQTPRIGDDRVCLRFLFRRFDSRLHPSGQ